eukprot:scaffold17932_cov58-Phaeocystis_antarctica.AAC.8
MAATATTASTANLLLRNLSERMRPPCMRALDRHVAATCPRQRWQAATRSLRRADTLGVVVATLIAQIHTSHAAPPVRRRTELAARDDDVAARLGGGAEQRDALTTARALPGDRVPTGGPATAAGVPAAATAELPAAAEPT